MSISEKQGALLPVLFLGVLMAALDIAILGPALPAIRAHFQVDDRTVAWVFNTFVFFNLVGVPLMSKLSDVFGRRRVYLLDVSLFALGALIVAAAPSWPVLLVGRAFQGLAASGIFPVAAAVVGDAYAPEERGKALGVLGAVFGIAFIIGPILAGLLLLVDWRLMYLVYVPMAAVVIAMGSRLPDNPAKQKRGLDWPGIALLGGVLVSMAYGINRIDAANLVDSISSPRVWMPAALFVIGLPLFIMRERRATDPLIRPGLFRSRQVALAAILAICAGLVESAFIFFPALSVAAFGVSQSQASFMLLPLVGAVAVVSPLAGRLLDRTGSRLIVLACQASLAAGITMVGWLGDSLFFFYLGSVLIGSGLAGILGPSLSYILLREARMSERTVSQGLITLFISIGQLVGGAAIGAIAASIGSGIDGYRIAFLGIGAVSGLVLVLAAGLKGRDAERA